MALCLVSCTQPVVLVDVNGTPIFPTKGNFPVSVRCTERVFSISDVAPLGGSENRLSAAVSMVQSPTFDVCLFLDETGGPDGGDSNVDLIIEGTIAFGAPFFEVFRVNLPTTAAVPIAVFVERFAATCETYRFRLINNTGTAYGVTNFSVTRNPNT